MSYISDQLCSVQIPYGGVPIDSYRMKIIASTGFGTFWVNLTPAQLRAIEELVRVHEAFKE